MTQREFEKLEIGDVLIAVEDGGYFTVGEECVIASAKLGGKIFGAMFNSCLEERHSCQNSVPNGYGYWLTKYSCPFFNVIKNN